MNEPFRFLPDGAEPIRFAPGTRRVSAHVVDADLIDVKGIVATLLRFSPLVAGGALLAGLLAAVFLLGADPTYRARAEVFLVDRDDRVIEIENVVGETVFGDRMILSETVVLRSRALLTDVARRLDLARYPEFNPALRPVGLTTRLKRTVRGLLGSGSASSEAAERAPEAIAAAALAGHVKATQLGLSFVIAIDVTSQDPDRAARIANTIAEVYLERQVAAKIQAGEGAVAWLDERVQDLRNQAIEAETAVTGLRANLRGDWQQSPESIERQLDELSVLLVRARQEEADAAARLDRFEALIAERNYGAAMEIASSAAMAGLEEARADALRQLVTIGAQTASAPSGRLSELQALTERVGESLAAEAVAVTQGLRSAAGIARDRAEALQARVQELERVMGEQSTQLIGLRELEREAEALQAVHAQFLGRLKEARERVSLQEPDARILSEASRPASPSSPSRTLLVLAAMLGGGLLTALGIVLWEARRDVFRRESDVERVLGRPALGALPVPVDPADIAPLLTRMAGEPHGVTAGQVARVAAALLDGRGGTGTRILVTSALPDEGAAGLACLLAAATARTGRSVRVVGLGPEADAVAVALEKARTAGEGAPAPTITVQRLARAEDADELTTPDETVFFAAPPVLATPEALRLARASDAALLAVRWSHTPRQAAVTALDDLGRADLAISVVLTAVRPHRQAFYDYRGRFGVVRALDRYARLRGASA